MPKGGRGRALLAALLAALVMGVPAAEPWGNGASNSGEFRYYGVHDAIAHLAYEKVRARDPAAAAFMAHWFLAAPGGYGDSYVAWNLRPQGADNFLGYTDEPDSTYQDWENHLYLVHPRPGHSEQGAPHRVASMMQDLRLNLTLHLALGAVPCNPVEHMAAFNAGVMAHYVGDLSQWGHTDDTVKDHSHPPDDPNDRTYHGYYESSTWFDEGLRRLLAEQRARPWTPRVVTDVKAAVVALARSTNMPDGVTVSYKDKDGATVQVGSQYRDMLVAYVAAYDAKTSLYGQRGWTPWLWQRTMDNVAGSVALLADLYHTAWTQARASVPSLAPPSPGPPGCPNA